MHSPVVNKLSLQLSLSQTLQLHSIDCYQRIGVEALPHLPWEHRCSVVDSADALMTKKGYTDWQATLEGRLFSLSWDWMHRFDCQVSYDCSNGLRTNILCVDGRGYDLSVATSEAMLSRVIEKLNWHQFVTVLH
ncbi:MAG: DUF4902 domain-containing protein [Rhodoferax sp.]